MTTAVFSSAGPLLLFLAKATLLLVVALVVTVPLRRGTAGSRHLVWLAALVGVLALPVLSRVESLRIGVLPTSMGLAAPRSTEPAVVSVPPRAAPTPVPDRTAPLARDANASTPVARLAGSASPVIGALSLASSIALVWSVVALTLVGWLIFGTWSVRRVVANARELTSPDWTMPLCEVADRLDLESPPRLMISDGIEMAFACRAFAPTIVLPASAETWADDRRRAVLFHELAHVKRHDLVSHTLSRVACALYWFHPLVWTAAKNLRAESERACDDLVLSCGARPSEYAQHLLEMVTSIRNHGAPLMALPMARKKEFEGRMLAILDPAIRRASPGRLQSAAVVSTLSLLSVMVAAVAPAAATPGHVEGSRIAAIAEAPEAAPAPRPSPAPALAPRVSPMGSAPAPQAASPAAESAPGATRTELDTARTAMLVRVLLSDPDARVRRTAAWGLAEAETPAARDALIKAFRSDGDAEVREMSAWSLAEYKGENVSSAFAEGLRDKSAKVRAISLWGLANIGSTRDLDAIEGAMSDSDDEVREMAIWAVGEMGIKSAPRLVVNALTDNSQRVRLAAAWALGEIADPSTANAITKAFETETSSRVLQAEIRALGEMERISQPVLDLALKSSDPELRQFAVAMLAGGSGAKPWPWPKPMARPTP